MIWASLAVSLLILISNFGMGGFVGEAISDFLFAALGWAAYAVPFLLFGMVAFTVSNKGNPNAYLKVGAGIVLTVLACTLFELLDEAEEYRKSIAQAAGPLTRGDARGFRPSGPGRLDEGIAARCAHTGAD